MGCRICGEACKEKEYLCSNCENRIGKLFPDWELDKWLADTGLAPVFRVVGKNDRSASKVLKIYVHSADDLAADEMIDAQEYIRFTVDEQATELDFMKSISGKPNVVGINEYKVEEFIANKVTCIPVLIDEYIPLTHYLSKESLQEKDVIRLGIDMCTALEAYHSKGFIHGNISVGEVYIDENGEFLLNGFYGFMQFGKKSTHKYIGYRFAVSAPEVLYGADFDGRADIYSLGHMLYKLMNNKRMPFMPQGKILPTMARKNESYKRLYSGEKVPAPCKASKEFSRIILKACEYKAEDRYSSVEEMKKALLLCRNTGKDRIINFFKRK